MMNKVDDFLDKLDKSEPDERHYALKNLIKHFTKSEKYAKKMYLFLTNFQFVRTKIVELGVESVILDYELALQTDIKNFENEIKTLAYIRDAIRLSEYPLRDDPRQLSGQLIGRLSHYTLADTEIKQPTSFFKLSGVPKFLINCISGILIAPFCGLVLLLVILDYSIVKNLEKIDKRKRDKHLKISSFLVEKTALLWVKIEQKLESLGIILRIILIDLPSLILRRYFAVFLLQTSGNQLKIRDRTHKVSENFLDIENFLEQVEKVQSEPWLRPLIPSLTMPGSSFSGFMEDALSSIERTIAISPDGKYLVSNADDKNLAVWDLKTRGRCKVLTGHNAQINSIAITTDPYSPQKVISGSDDTTVHVWDLESGSSLKTFIGHTAAVSTVAVTSDPKVSKIKIVSGSRDKTLIVWDLESGDLLWILSGHTKGINDIAITPDGKRSISASDDQTLAVWDLQNGKLLYSLIGHKSYVTAVTVTTDGNRVISGSGDGEIILWDLNSQKIIDRQSRTGNSIISIANIPDGKGFIMASSDPSIRIWNISETTSKIRSEVFLSLEKTIREVDDISAISISPDSRLVVSGSASELRVWNFHSYQEQKSITGHGSNCPVNSIDITPDGRYAITASSDHSLRIWETHSGKPLKDLENHNGEVKFVAINFEGTQVVSIADKITVWDLRTGFPFKTFENLGANTGSLSSKGHLALWGGTSRKMVVLDLNTGQEIEHLTKFLDWEDSCGSAILFTPDEKELVFSSQNDLIGWNCQTGEKTFSLRGYKDWIRAISITLDGRILATASGNEIDLWSLETRSIVKTITGHANTITAISISADNKHLVSTSVDKSVRVWQLSSGKEIARFTGEHRLCSCALSPDARTIVAGESLGRVHFLRLENFALRD